MSFEYRFKAYCYYLNIPSPEQLHSRYTIKLDYCPPKRPIYRSSSIGLDAATTFGQSAPRSECAKAAGCPNHISVWLQLPAYALITMAPKAAAKSPKVIRETRISISISIGYVPLKQPTRSPPESSQVEQVMS
jgi:hypothetical protein